MKGRIYSAIIVLTLVFLLLPFAAHAKICRARFEVFTTNYTDINERQLNVWLAPTDTESKHPPNFVASITVTAPDTTQFVLTTSNWQPYDRGYWGKYYAADFVSATIPTGSYKVDVVDNDLNSVTEFDYLRVIWLDPPTITWPTEASTVGATPNITWTPVSNASYYRLLLWNDTRNEPVSWFWDKQFRVDGNTFTPRTGDLPPNCSYSLRIEARGESQDLDWRSRSDWVHFSTGSY